MLRNEKEEEEVAGDDTKSSLMQGQIGSSEAAPEKAKLSLYLSFCLSGSHDASFNPSELVNLDTCY